MFKPTYCSLIFFLPVLNIFLVLLFFIVQVFWSVWSVLPGLYKAALPCDSCFWRQVDCCEQHIRNLKKNLLLLLWTHFFPTKLHLKLHKTCIEPLTSANKKIQVRPFVFCRGNSRWAEQEKACWAHRKGCDRSHSLAGLAPQTWQETHNICNQPLWLSPSVQT